MRAMLSITTIAFLGLVGCSDGAGSGGAGGASGSPGGRDGGPSSSTLGTGGSNLGAGGSPGLGGTSGAGGTSAGATGPLIPTGCNVPSCYGDLITACTPSGTCVEQDTGASSNSCYSDGGKVIAALDMNTLSMSMIFKKNGGVCFSMVSDSATGVMNIKDASGNTVGTIADSTTGDSVVTCTGKAPVTLNQACNSVGGGSDSGSSCTSGTCSP